MTALIRPATAADHVVIVLKSRVLGVVIDRSEGTGSNRSFAQLAPHQHRVGCLVDFVVCADADAGEIVLLVDFPRLRDGTVHDVVHGSQGDRVLDRWPTWDHIA